MISYLLSLKGKANKDFTLHRSDYPGCTAPLDPCLGCLRKHYSADINIWIIN